MAKTLNWIEFVSQVSQFLGKDPDRLLRETHIYEEIGLDSLGMFSLGMYLIKCFGVTLPLSEVATISTLGDMYQALDRHRSDAT